MQQTLYKNSSYLVFTSFYILQTSALNRNLQRALVFLKAFLKKDTNTPENTENSGPQNIFRRKTTKNSGPHKSFKKKNTN